MEMMVNKITSCKFMLKKTLYLVLKFRKIYKINKMLDSARLN